MPGAEGVPQWSAPCFVKVLSRCSARPSPAQPRMHHRCVLRSPAPNNPQVGGGQFGLLGGFETVRMGGGGGGAIVRQMMHGAHACWSRTTDRRPPRPPPAPGRDAGGGDEHQGAGCAAAQEPVLMRGGATRGGGGHTRGGGDCSPPAPPTRRSSFVVGTDWNIALRCAACVAAVWSVGPPAPPTLPPPPPTLPPSPLERLSAGPSREPGSPEYAGRCEVARGATAACVAGALRRRPHSTPRGARPPLSTAPPRVHPRCSENMEWVFSSDFTTVSIARGVMVDVSFRGERRSRVCMREGV